jgi:hypothetical protein
VPLNVILGTFSCIRLAAKSVSVQIPFHLSTNPEHSSWLYWSHVYRGCELKHLNIMDDCAGIVPKRVRLIVIQLSAQSLCI